MFSEFKNGNIFLSKIKENPRYIIVFLSAVLSFFVAIFCDKKILNDGDTFMHIAAGQWMLRHHAVPHDDPFSYSFFGAPWVAHEWLSEVLMALAYNGGGWSAVLVLMGLAYALTMVCLAIFLEHRVRGLLPICLTLLLSFIMTLPSLLARPHLLALPCFALWSICLLRAREKGNTPPSWPAVLILLLWANLHGSFALGLFLILPFAFEAVLAEKHARLSVLGAWGRFMLFGCIAVAITPNGWDGLLFPFQLIMMPQMTMIQEWQPMHIQIINPFVLASCTFVYVVITRRLRIPPIRWVLLFGFGYLSVRHIRYELLTGVFVPLLLAVPLGRMGGESSQNTRIEWDKSTPQCFAIVAALGVLAGVRMVCPFVLTDRLSAPVSALASVPD